jgi:hypothetical protein
VLAGIFTAEEVDAVGDKGSGDTTMVDVQTHFKVFLNMFLRSAYFIDKASYYQKAKLPYSLRVSDYQDFKSIECQIKGILVYCIQKNSKKVNFHMFIYMLK